MASQTLAPDSIISQSGMGTCILSDVTSDPDSPDANYCTAASQYTNTTLRVSFPTPTNAPKQGAGLQEFRVEYRRSGTLFVSPKPTIKIAIRETGGGVDLASTTFNVLNDYSSHVLSFTWDASLLSTANGSKVECYLVVTHQEDPEFGWAASADIGGAEWVSEYASSVSGDIAVTAPKPSVSATGAYTPPQQHRQGDIAVTAPKPTVAATGAFTQQHRQGDIAVSAPKPGVFAAASYAPVNDSSGGTTGWIKPDNASVRNGDDSGVTISNASNIAFEDQNIASVNLQISGGGSVQESKRLEWDWGTPPYTPSAEAVVAGVELIAYVQYDEDYPQSYANIYPYYFEVGDINVEIANVSDHAVAVDTDASPVYDNALFWGGPTELLGLPANTLVSDFLAQQAVTDRNAYIKMRCDSGSYESTFGVWIGHIKMRVYYTIPNYVDMAATPSLGVTVADSSPLQKIRDMASAPSGSVTAGGNKITANPYNVAADINCSVVVPGPTISEGTTDIDIYAELSASVSLGSPTVVRMRNMAVNPTFTVLTGAEVGYEHYLDAAIPVSVVMTPRLYRDVEMQTNAIGAWFQGVLDGDGLLGDFSLETNLPVSVVLDPDGMIVDWALYANGNAGVTIDATIDRMTNLSSDFALSVTASPVLSADINMYSDVTMDGIFLNTSFVRLPVPVFEDRTVYVEAKDATLTIPERERTLEVTRQQRNP